MSKKADKMELDVVCQGEPLPKPANRKKYLSPSLTQYGRMSELTQAGGGPGPNDGDYQVGTPIKPS
ncbi:MAG: hypothetical protein SH820_00725 [Xanthomonadales bacterium]|nr:hypothetical protein [Xanthomonadales bacterium]